MATWTSRESLTACATPVACPTGWQRYFDDASHDAGAGSPRHALTTLAGAPQLRARRPGDRDPGGRGRAEERGHGGRGPGRRGREPGRRVRLPFPAGHLALAVACGLRRGADRGDPRLRVPGPAVGRGPVGRALAGRGRDRAAGAGREPAGLADARAPGPAACPAPVPDHEPEVRRREGREVRPEAQGRRARRRGVPHRRPRARRRGRGSPPGRRAEAPICSASPEATERRPWWPGSPPSTASRSW